MGANDPLPGLRSEHTIAKKPGPFPHKSTAKSAHLRRPAPTVGGPPSKVGTSVVDDDHDGVKLSELHIEL